MALNVNVTITDELQNMGSAGFGCPLVLVENASAAKEYAEFESLADMAEGGYAETDDAYKIVRLMFMQTNSPAKVAVCSTDSTATAWLAVDANLKKDWRQLVVVSGGEDATEVADIMASVEAITEYEKFYYANVDFDDATSYTVDGIKRTVLCYYTPTDDIPSPVAAIAGEIGGSVPGSYAMHTLKVSGVPGLELSKQEKAAIHGKGGVTLVLEAGDVVVSDGKSAGGVWVDHTDNNDYIKQQVEYKIQKIKNNNSKIPYTNAGIGMIETAVTGVMMDAIDKTMIESIDDVTIKFPSLAETTAEERAARQLRGEVSYRLSGAIKDTTINISVRV